jgi:hypothetical protein
MFLNLEKKLHVLGKILTRGDINMKEVSVFVLYVLLHPDLPKGGISWLQLSSS